MIFFGTQPTLTQVPPRRPDSASATRAPYSAARRAVATPPLPPPITTRSNFSDMTSPLLPGMLYEVAGRALPAAAVRRKGRYNGAHPDRTGMHG